MLRWIAHINVGSFFPSLEGDQALPPERYVELSNQLRELLARFSPRLEPESLDRFFLDITEGLGPEGTVEQILEALQKSLLAVLKLKAAIGAGPSKLVARLAAEAAEPEGILVVPSEQVLDFLTPRSVRRLWSIQPKVGIELAGMGIQTLGDLRRIPLSNLVAHFGKTGYRLAMLAQGQDPLPEPKSKPGAHPQTAQLALPFDSKA